MESVFDRVERGGVGQQAAEQIARGGGAGKARGEHREPVAEQTVGDEEGKVEIKMGAKTAELFGRPLRDDGLKTGLVEGQLQRRDVGVEDGGVARERKEEGGAKGCEQP